MHGYTNVRPFLMESNIAKFNTIVSGKDTTCTISNDFNNGSGAYTNMVNFNVHLPLLMNNDVVDAKAIWGVDLHELSHILFSPNLSDHKSLEGNFGNIYVYAEENRIENLYHIMAPGNKELMSYGVRKATNFDEITNKLDSMNDSDKFWNYYLNCLRPWNDNGWMKHLREDVCNDLGEDVVNRIEELVLEYAMLSKKDIPYHAPKIFKELKSLIPYKSEDAEEPQCQGHMGGLGDMNIDDSGVTQEFQNFMGGNSNEDDSGSNGGGNSNEDVSEGSSIANKIGAKDAEGTKPMKGDGELAIESNQATREHNTMSGLMAGNEYYPLRTYPKVISNDEKVAMKVFRRKLEELEEELDPGYINNLPSGSIYINEAMKPNRDINKMFRQWDAGATDLVGIEAVILLDNSGSMIQGNMEECASKTWSFAKALEALGDSNVTIIAFNSGHDYLYNNVSQMGATQMNVPVTDGGTKPKSALIEAEGIFNNSLLDKKMLLVFTDGAWYGGKSAGKMVKRMGDSGVSTGMIFFDNGWGGSGAHQVADSFQYSITSNDMDDLAKMGKTIVNNLMDTW